MSNYTRWDGLATETQKDFKTTEYVPGTVKRVACGKCGGYEFYIGIGQPGMYLTMAMCTKCNIPFALHEG